MYNSLYGWLILITYGLTVCVRVCVCVCKQDRKGKKEPVAAA